MNTDKHASTHECQEAIEGFETGNTFALLLASDVATRHDFELKKKAAVLVNFDFPPTIQAGRGHVHYKPH